MSHEEALLLRWAEVAWGGALAVALLAGVRALPAAWRMLRHGPWAERATLLAVAVAWLLRPGGVGQMANWYADLVLPGEAVRTARYGPGWPVLQGGVRDLGLDLAAGDLTALAGVVAVVLTARLAVLLGLGRRVGAWAAWSLAVMPLHVHLSGSTAEHVVSATLLLGATVAWLKACTPVDQGTETTGVSKGIPTQWAGLVAAITLAHTAALVRIDAWPLALAVPLATLALPSPIPWRRAVVPGVVFGVAWAIQGLALHEWVAIPSHAPLPTLEERLHALRDAVFAWGTLTWPFNYRLPILPQFLVAVGAIRLLVRNWRVVVVAAAAGLLPAVAVARMPHDEVNLRYFAAALPWLALIVARGMADAASTVWHKRYGSVVVVAAALCMAGVDLFLPLVARPPLAFANENMWLGSWLRDYRGCQVHQVSPLGWQTPRDLDCCLDAPRSTAALVPGVTFADRRAQADPPRHDWSKLGPPPLPPLGPGCNLWYEGAICHLAPSQELRAQMGPGIDAIAARCAEWRKRTVGEALEEDWVSQRAIDPWFVDQDHRGVQIRLWRVQ